jgi:bifunctional DNase/RNase
MRVPNRAGRLMGLGLGGLMAAALALLLALPVAGVLGLAKHADSVELRELFVREIVAAEELGSELVVLQAVDEAIVIPVFVTPEDGKAIRDARDGGGAADLVEQTAAALGATVRAVVLQQVGSSLAASVIVEEKGDQTSIEVSPGAAIATAISAGQPILTTPDAMAAAGLDDDDLRRMTEAEGESPDLDRPSLSL